MQDATCPPARVPMFFGLYMAEALCWSTGASRLPDGAPGPLGDPQAPPPSR